jgi:diacylglycerol kinase (ATP)
VKYNGINIEEKMVGVVVANGHSCGGGMKLTPSAKVNDGVLDLLVMHNMNIPELIQQFMKIYSGSHIESGHFTYEQTDCVKVESDLNVRVETDGELLGSLPVEVKVVPKGLKVKCNL